MFTFKDDLASELAQIEADGLFKRERHIDSAQSNRILAGQAGQEAVETLNFCANNYLGLADDPRLIAAAKRGLDERGFGMASVRFICGTQDRHLVLEQRISEFLGTADEDEAEAPEAEAPAADEAAADETK